jgi:hypothetical protein
MEDLDKKGAALVGDHTAAGAGYYDILVEEGGDPALSLARNMVKAGRAAARCGEGPVDANVKEPEGGGA